MAAPRLTPEELSARWESTFQQVVKYHTERGQYPSPQDQDPQVRRLGLWVFHQRQNYRNGRLRPEFVTKLQEFSAWTWDSSSVQRDPPKRVTPQNVNLWDLYLQNQRLLKQQNLVLRTLYPPQQSSE